MAGPHHTHTAVKVLAQTAGLQVSLHIYRPVWFTGYKAHLYSIPLAVPAFIWSQPNSREQEKHAQLVFVKTKEKVVIAPHWFNLLSAVSTLVEDLNQSPPLYQRL